MHLVQENFITSITIPNYIREVKISNKVRPKYWEWNGITIKCGSRKLLKKYINPDCKRDIILNDGNILPKHLKIGYNIVGFRGNKIASSFRTSDGYEEKYLLTASQLDKPIKYYLCEQKSEKGNYFWDKVIANPTKVDKPRFHIINGQNIYNHTANPFTTGKVFDAIKSMYYDKFKSVKRNKIDALRLKLSTCYPIMVIMEIRDTVKNYYDNTKKGNGRRWDVGNRTDPYMKTFLDFLANGYTDKEGNILLHPLIKDDDRLHVSTGNNSFFTPIEPYETRSLVIHIYKDDRLCWENYLRVEEEQWNEYTKYLLNHRNEKNLIDVATREGFEEWKLTNP